jgi:hypothetical protein
VRVIARQQPLLIHYTTEEELLEVVSEGSRTVVVVTDSVKEDERGVQGHTSTSLFYQSAT